MALAFIVVRCWRQGEAFLGLGLNGLNFPKVSMEGGKKSGEEGWREEERSMNGEKEQNGENF